MKRIPLLPLLLLCCAPAAAQTKRDTLFYPDSRKIRSITITKGAKAELQTFYENGKLGSLSYTKDKVRDGDLKEYSPDGKLSHSCTYETGNKTGKEVYYFPDGSVKKATGWKIQTNEKSAPVSVTDGEQREYSSPGHLLNVQHYKDGKKDGVCEEWFDNGKQRNSVTYAGGYTIGPCQYWNREGKLTFSGAKDTLQARYTNGNPRVEEVKSGLCKTYNSSGILTEEGTYVKGKREGLVRTRYENGQLESEIMFHEDKVAGQLKRLYKNGQLQLSAQQFVTTKPVYTTRYEGHFEEYYENGNPKSKGDYKNGKKNGPWKEWRDTILTMEAEYANGQLINQLNVYNSKNGKLQRTTTYVHATINNRDTTLIDGELKSYNDNGQLVRQEFYKMGVLQVNNTKEFLPGGQTRLEYIDEGDHVRKVEYNDNGTKSFEAIAPKKNGESPAPADFRTTLQYDMNGKLRREMNYRDGNLAGVATEYNEQGKVISEGLLFAGAKDRGPYFGYIDNAWNGLRYMDGSPWRESYNRYSQQAGCVLEWYINGKLKRVLLAGVYDVQWLSNGELMSVAFFKDHNPNTILDSTVSPVFAQQLYDRFSRSKNKMLLLHGAPDGWQRSYYDEKQVHFETYIRNGQPDSIFRGYYPDGSLFVEWHLRNGIADGQYVVMNANHTVLESGQYLNGKACCAWKMNSPEGVPYKEYELDTAGPATSYSRYTYEKEFYPVSGKIKTSYRYRNGKHDGLQQTWAENGTLTGEWTSRNDTTIGDYRTWNDKGEPTRHTQYDSKGLKNGIDEYWTWKGVPQSALHYENNVAEGAARTYWPNGKLRSEGQYIKGEANGKWTMYDSLGRRQPDVVYNKGMREAEPDPNPCSCEEPGRKIGFAPLLTSLVDSTTFPKWQFRFHTPVPKSVLANLFYMDYQNSYSRDSRFNSLTVICYRPIEVRLPDEKGMTLVLNPCKGMPSQIGINANTVVGDPDQTHMEITPRQLALRFDDKILHPVAKGAKEVTANFTVKFMEYEKQGITLHQPQSLCFTESFIGKTNVKLQLSEFHPYIASLLRDELSPANAYEQLGEKRTGEKTGSGRFTGIGMGKGSVSFSFAKSGDVKLPADNACGNNRFMSLMVHLDKVKSENDHLIFTDMSGKTVTTTEAELTNYFKNAGFSVDLVKSGTDQFTLLLQYTP